MSGLVFQCPGCGYRYDESVGDEYEGYAPQTPFASLPEDYVCPDCAVRGKQDFILLGDDDREQSR